METEDVVKLLTTYSESEAHDRIPEGSKNDVYFVIKNSGNSDKRSRGQQSSFSDDCGVWDTNKGSSPKTYYHVTSDGKLKNIFKNDRIYCTVKRVNKKRVYIPIEPQPSADSVYELSRSYASLKKDANY